MTQYQEQRIDIPKAQAKMGTIEVTPFQSAQGLVVKIYKSTEGEIYHTIDTNFFDDDNPNFVTGKLLT